MAEVDYKQVGSATPMTAFSRKLAEVAQKFTKLHKPFDEPCARLEFMDKLENASKESERKNGFVSDNIDIDFGDLEAYGNENLFELVEDQEDYVDKVIEGSRTQVVVGHTLSYKCKKRGHGISVFIPIAEYNAMKDSVKIKQKNNKEE